jgi:hypothetical protein
MQAMAVPIWEQRTVNHTWTFMNCCRIIYFPSLARAPGKTDGGDGGDVVRVLDELPCPSPSDLPPRQFLMFVTPVVD